MNYNNVVYTEINYDGKMKEWIKVRKANGISQSDIATEMGTSESVISLIESFKRRSLAAYYYYKTHFGRLKDI